MYYRISLFFILFIIISGCASTRIIDSSIRDKVYKIEVYGSNVFSSYSSLEEQFHKKAAQICNKKPYKNTLLKTSGATDGGNPAALGVLISPDYVPLVTGEVYCENAIQSIIIEAKNGNRIRVLGLIEEGANVNAVDEISRTALMYACMNGYIKIVKDLLGSGANINHKDINNNSALTLAKKSNYNEIIDILVEKSASE